MNSMIHFPDGNTPLYISRDQLLPTDYPQPKTKIMGNNKEALGSLGKLIAAHVIARPHDELVALLPK